MPPHGHADVRGGQGGRVVDAVADHDHPALALQVADQAQFVFRQQLRVDLQPEGPGDRLPGPGVVPGQHDGRDAQRAQVLDGGLRVGARFVPQGDQAPDGAVHEEHHDRLALVFQLRDAGLGGAQVGVLAGVAGRADGDVGAVHAGQGGLTREGAGVLRGGQRSAQGSVRGQQRAPQWWLLPCSAAAASVSTRRRPGRCRSRR